MESRSAWLDEEALTPVIQDGVLAEGFDMMPLTAHIHHRLFLYRCEKVHRA